MTDQQNPSSRRFPRSVVVIATVALTLVILAGGAFAVGRSTATHPTSHATYSQTTAGTATGPMGTWMRQHRDDIAWMRQHAAQWNWMRHHLDDMAWLRNHPSSWSWMRDHMDDLPWLREHSGQWQWLRNHPNSWSWMRDHMNNMMSGQGTWQR